MLEVFICYFPRNFLRGISIDGDLFGRFLETKSCPNDDSSQHTTVFDHNFAGSLKEKKS